MLLKTITEKEIYPNTPYEERGSFADRPTGKCILFDTEGNIAVVVRTAHPYVLLPGGGINEGESIEAGTLRECMEETGCTIELVEEIGSIEEFRLRDMKRVVTHCFVGQVVGEKGTPELTKDEALAGLHVLWMSFEEAFAKMAAQLSDLTENKVKFYNAGFNMNRDYIFMAEAKKRLLEIVKLFLNTKLT